MTRMVTAPAETPAAPGARPSRAPAGRGWSRNTVETRVLGVLRWLVIAGLALFTLFPFYYMVVGSLQRDPDTSPGGAFPEPGNLTGENYGAINGSIDLLRGVVNSGIFTGGVILCTVIFGVLAGYALRLDAVGGRLFLSGVDHDLAEQLRSTGFLTTAHPVEWVEATEILGESTNAAAERAAAWLAEGPG